MFLVGSFGSSGYGSFVGFVPKFFIVNNKLLKPLSPALNNNPKLLKKRFFNCFLSLPKLFNFATKLLLSSSASSDNKHHSCISLKKE